MNMPTKDELYYRMIYSELVEDGRLKMAAYDPVTQLAVWGDGAVHDGAVDLMIQNFVDTIHESIARGDELRLRKEAGMWHYQIGKKMTKAGEVFYGIYEVFYRGEDSEKPFLYSETPEQVIGESPDDVKEQLAMMMLDALKHGIIDLDDPNSLDQTGPKRS
jgi:hypothetical protein